MKESLQKISEAISAIDFTGEVRFREDLANHTSFRIGGPADCLLVPSSRIELLETLARVRKEGIKSYILGNGTNILAPDRGIRGVVIEPGPALSHFQFAGNILKTGAGCNLSTLAQEAGRQGLSGLEFAAGIPGTVGGAVFMNAGYGAKDIAGVLSRVTVLLPGGGVRTLTPSDCSFSYRDSRFRQSEGIILEAEFQLRDDTPASIKKRMTANLRERKRSFPLAAASAGCVFKNPPADTAGRLIESAGLKGRRAGNARISKQHANFIINSGGAKARDVLELIDLTRRKVREKFGINLELELIIWE